MNLKDPQLLTGRVLIGGRWLAGDATHEVLNPATGDDAGHRAQHGRGRDAPGNRGGERRLPGVGGAHRQGTRGDPAPLV